MRRLLLTNSSPSLPPVEQVVRTYFEAPGIFLLTGVTDIQFCAGSASRYAEVIQIRHCRISISREPLQIMDRVITVRFIRTGEPFTTRMPTVRLWYWSQHQAIHLHKTAIHDLSWLTLES